MCMYIPTCLQLNVYMIVQMSSVCNRVNDTIGMLFGRFFKPLPHKHTHTIVGAPTFDSQYTSMYIWIKCFTSTKTNHNKSKRVRKRLADVTTTAPATIAIQQHECIYTKKPPKHSQSVTKQQPSTHQKAEATQNYINSIRFMFMIFHFCWFHFSIVAVAAARCCCCRPFIVIETNAINIIHLYLVALLSHTAVSAFICSSCCCYSYYCH